MNQTTRQFYGFLLLLLLAACNNNDVQQRTAKKTQELYADYRVRAEEGNENVSCLFRFRKGGVNGQPVTLVPPAEIRFDGETLAADSAGLSGTYYEIMLPLQDFSGTHHIEYTDAGGNIYKETFSFLPFTFKNEFPPVVSRKNWRFEMQGLGQKELLSVIATDTAFMSNDLNRIDTVENGILYLPSQALTELVNGPVFLTLHREQRLKLANPPKGGGRILVTYNLKREFVLKD